MEKPFAVTDKPLFVAPGPLDATAKPFGVSPKSLSAQNKPFEMRETADYADDSDEEFSISVLSA